MSNNKTVQYIGSSPTSGASFTFTLGFGAGGGTRTRTTFYGPRSLSPVRLPFRHTGGQFPALKISKPCRGRKLSVARLRGKGKSVTAACMTRNPLCAMLQPTRGANRVSPKWRENEN